MSRKDKLVKKLSNNPKNFSWQELAALLNLLGFIEMQNKKTGGSRRKFFNKEKNLIINLHKPHPSPYLKEYAVKQIQTKLKEEGLI